MQNLPTIKPYFIPFISDGWQEASDDEDSDGSWQDVVHSSDDEDVKVQGENPADSLSVEERKARASQISSTRVLTQEEFKVSH